MLTRRNFLKTGAACATLAIAGTRARLAFAALPDDRRFAVVIIRGGLDGLAAVPAYGDPNYASLRGSLALPRTGAGAPFDLDGFFGLHPALRNLAAMWRAKELAVYHNVSTPYRDRSHFDAQNVLETGATKPRALIGGWLNRALAPLGFDDGKSAMAVSSSPPLILDGASRVASWTPVHGPVADEEFFERVSALYAKDPVLSGALKNGLATRKTVAAAREADPASAMSQPQGDIATMMEGAGRIMAADGGARVAAFDVSGWDSHLNQGAAEGVLARRLQALDDGLGWLKSSMGSAWQKTAVVAVSEFGRTVRVNGTGGTDHGTAGMALVLGGAVAGGIVHAEWRGLTSSVLRDGRDLPAQTDTRAIFKGALAEHLGVPAQALDNSIFPESSDAPALKGLIRA